MTLNEELSSFIIEAVPNENLVSGIFGSAIQFCYESYICNPGFAAGELCEWLCSSPGNKLCSAPSILQVPILPFLRSACACRMGSKGQRTAVDTGRIGSP